MAHPRPTDTNPPLVLQPGTVEWEFRFGNNKENIDPALFGGMAAPLARSKARSADPQPSRPQRVPLRKIESQTMPPDEMNPDELAEFLEQKKKMFEDFDEFQLEEETEKVSTRKTNFRITSKMDQMKQEKELKSKSQQKAKSLPPSSVYSGVKSKQVKTVDLQGPFQIERVDSKGTS